MINARGRSCSMRRNGRNRIEGTASGWKVITTGEGERVRVTGIARIPALPAQVVPMIKVG